MARPPKDPKSRMTEEIRIRVTGEQHQAIVEAAKEDPLGVSNWAREILLKTIALARRKSTKSG